MVVSACTGDDAADPVPTTAATSALATRAGALADVAVATAAAGPARIQGTTAAPGGEPSGEVAGTVSTEPSEGTLTFALPFEGAAHPIELRWTADAVYVDRIEVPELVEGQPTPFLRLPGEAEWAGSVRPYGNVMMGIFDPGIVLAFAGTPAASRVEVGSEEVAGVDTRHLAVTGMSPSGLFGAPWTQFDLWIDGEDRLRRVRAEGEALVVDYELVELGVDLAVEPIPDAELGQFHGAAPEEPPAPAGSLIEVASGESEGIRWTLFRGPSTIDGDCWRLETSEPFSQAYPTLPDGTICPQPITADDPTEFQIQFPIDGDGTSTVDAIVAVLPPGMDLTSATIGFIGGATEPVAIDQERGLVVWVGRGTRTPGYMQLVTTTDQTFGCGAGHVTAVADLEVEDPVQIETLRLAPWLCLED